MALYYSYNFVEVVTLTCFKVRKLSLTLEINEFINIYTVYFSRSTVAPFRAAYTYYHAAFCLSTTYSLALFTIKPVLRGLFNPPRLRRAQLRQLLYYITTQLYLSRGILSMVLRLITTFMPAISYYSFLIAGFTFLQRICVLYVEIVSNRLKPRLYEACLRFVA